MFTGFSGFFEQFELFVFLKKYLPFIFPFNFLPGELTRVLIPEFYLLTTAANLKWSKFSVAFTIMKLKSFALAFLKETPREDLSLSVHLGTVCANLFVKLF